MIFDLLKRRRTRELQARADATEMMARLGYRAHDVARRHAQAEADGVGIDIFAPSHWAQVRRIIREAYPREH